jgi:hypothetical protein
MAFLEDGRDLLEAAWSYPPAAPEPLPAEISADIEAVLNTGGVTYPYALLTQVLGCVLEPQFDPKSIQKGCRESNGISDEASWDARSLAHGVVVPWNQRAEYPLGTSNEPYLNKPLRFPYFDDAMRRAQKRKDKFDALLRVLQFCTDQPGLRRAVLDEIIAAGKRRISVATIVFSPPLRLDTARLGELIRQFLAVRSGGLRLQIVVCALFRAEAKGAMNIEVKTDRPTVADAAALTGADVRITHDETLAMLIEVKDRAIAASDVTGSIRKARAAAATELKIVVADAAPIPLELHTIAAREFANGMTVSLIAWQDLFAGYLALSDVNSRSRLLRAIGDLLNELRASQEHKIHWRDLLAAC